MSSSSVSPSSITPSYSDLPMNESSFWSPGTLTIFILFLLFLVALLAARHFWKRRCLVLYYHGGAERSCSFLAQYLFRLTFDLNPSGHHKGCQVWADVVYEKEDVFTIPLNLTKLVSLKHKPTSQALVRTNRRLSNIRMATLKLMCAPNCDASTSHQSNRVTSDAKIKSLSIQDVRSNRMISTQVGPSDVQVGGGPKRKSPSLAQHTSERRARRVQDLKYAQEYRWYTFANDTYQTLDYNAIRQQLIHPFESWIVFNFTTLCLIFFLVGALKTLMVAIGSSVASFLGIAILVGTFGSIAFFMSAQYLFITRIQGPYLATFGRSLSACLLHVGLLTLSVLLGLGAAFAGVTLLQPVDLHLTEESEEINNLKWVTLSIIMALFGLIETVVCLLDAYTGFLGHSLWPSDSLACPGQEEGNPQSE